MIAQRRSELRCLSMWNKSKAREKMAKETLEDKAGKAVLRIEQKVSKIYDILMDVGAKITHVLEHKDYRTLPYSELYYEGA